MAVREGFVSADPQSGLLIDRAKTVSKGSNRQRLLAWGAMVALVLVAARLAMPGRLWSPSALVLMSTLVLAASASFGAAVYCFARFILGRELRYLWAADAFFALSGGTALQIVADLRSGTPGPHCLLITSAWLVAGLFFLASSLSDSVWVTSSRRERVVQCVLGVLLTLAFPLAACPYALDPLLLVHRIHTPASALTFWYLETGAETAAPVLLVLALFGYRRRRSADDRMLGLVCYLLVACTIALVARAASSQRFDQWWAVSQVVSSTAWIALIAGVGLENAIAQRNGTERLEELETLHHVSWSLVGAGTSIELLGMFVRTLCDKLDARITAVYLADSHCEELELAALHGSDEIEGYVGTRYRVATEERRPGFDTGHTARAFKSKEIHIAEDVFVDVEFVPWRQIAVDDGCAASIPLMHQGSAIGVLNVYYCRSRQLTRQRLRLLATVAAAATPAIHYALARERAEPAAQDDSIRLAA